MRLLRAMCPLPENGLADADQICLIQDEKELTPIVRLSNNVNQLANNTVKVIYALVSLSET